MRMRGSDEISEVPIPGICSRTAPWEPAERDQPLPPKGIRLDDVWDALTSPALLTDGRAIAQAVGVRRNTWDQWIRRARLRVLSELGSEKCRALFPHWPRRSGAEPIRRTGQRRGG